MQGEKRFRTAGLLILIALPGILSLIPAMLQSVEAVAGAAGVPVPVLIAAAILQSVVLVTIAAFAGAALAPRVGLGAPLLQGQLGGGQALSILRQHARPSFTAGLAAAALMLLLEHLVFRPYLPPALSQTGAQPSLLALISGILYGGIVEEILVRWGIMALIVWVLWRVSGAKEPVKPAFVWIGILGAALLFGAGHLPATRALVGELTTPLIVRALVLNGVGGVIYGWLFYRRGLEAAMIAHMGSHVGFYLAGLIAWVF